MLYQSLKLTNGIWVLAELKIQPNNPNFMVSWYNHFDVYVRMSLEYVENIEVVYLEFFRLVSVIPKSQSNGCIPRHTAGV